MWSTRTCLTREVVRDRFSMSISFLDSKGEEFWVTEVYSPPRIKGRVLFYLLRDVPYLFHQCIQSDTQGRGG